MFFFRLIALALFICGCSCTSSRSAMRIGVDPNWYPLNFGPQVSFVNGYVEDLLIEMNQYSGMRFELVKANWDTLEEGLVGNKYDAIFSSITPLASNMAKYDFSEPILETGPVLIISEKEDFSSLKQMQGHAVGIIMNDKASTILEAYPEIYIRSYENIPDLLNAVVLGDLQGALLSRIPAVNFVSDLYSKQLKIVGKPYTNAGIRLVTLKGKDTRFDQTLTSLKKRKVLKQLQKKWQL